MARSHRSGRQTPWALRAAAGLAGLFAAAATLAAWSLGAAPALQKPLPHDASIVAALCSDEWGVLGGVIDDAWVPAQRLGGNLRPSITCVLYSLTGRLGTATRRTMPMDAQDASIFAPSVTITPARGVSAANACLAVSGRANPLLRPVTVVKDVTPYLEPVRRFLLSERLTRSVADVQRVIRADLDGDGTTESVIAAAHARGDIEQPSAGDYSCILVEGVVNGKKVVRLLAGSFSRTAIEGPYGLRCGVTAVADIDRDGVMEVIVDWHAYESWGSEILGYRAGRVHQIPGPGAVGGEG